MGLEKAIIAEGIKRMVEIEGDCTMYIPTDTWSYMAINIYRWDGFDSETSEPMPGGYKNQTALALPRIRHFI